jgi:uncharacterized protein (TIGR02118 family)
LEIEDSMTISFILTFRNPARPQARTSEADKSRFVGIVKTTPGLRKALVYEPQSADDPYLNDGAPPQLAAQLYFADIADLEAALAHAGHLQALVAPNDFPSLSGTAVTQQAMLSRAFRVPDAAFSTGEPHCTYLVSYEGSAADLNAWLHHYIANHPPLMAKFPGIREIEVCTRIDWCGFLPWPRVDYMLRNKVVFDNAAALTAALNSPVRHEMRADYKTFPPFTGPVSHFPMATFAIEP